MEERIILVFFLSTFLGFNQGCQIGGNISLGPVPQQLFINDTFRENIISEATTDIVGITSINYGGALTGGPYLDITHVDSQLVVRPSGAFEQYEENEVAMFISVTVTFSCTGGSTSPLILVINIQDTNNNSPQFRPSNELEFVVAPPLPPGFLVTGCYDTITIRDIDLTTSRIIFEIEDNPYFEIVYDEVATAAAPSKEFKALLRTSTFIRTLREPVTLTITATDVDATGDPPRTASGTIRISGDTEFEFPEEPVFTRTFYIAQYTDDHQLALPETISLQQGFDEHVNFTLDGEYKTYFTLTPTGNEASLAVTTHLPVEVLAEKQIYLIVRADREYTSGASATIVIYLPQVTPLLFASALYEGALVDGDLQLSSLVLAQGFEGATVTVDIVGEHSTRFTAIVQGNLVNISMAPIADSFIEDKSYISMQIVASTARSEAATIVSLEIIKDDNVTPAFDKSIYTGSYDPDNGLDIERITFVQGFDETVSVEVVGEHERFFQIIEPGPTLNLTSSVIPPELFVEQRITLSIEATKHRTVGASAVIIIALPSARQLEFGMPSYRGTILDNELTIQNVSLSVGYDEGVQFNLSGDYSTYFNVSNVQNQVTITLPGPLPDSVIDQNSALMLTLTATGLNALPARTTVLLVIMKDDTTTPVFSRNIYHGVYRGPTDFQIDDIFLTQGFDDQVSFRLDDSAHAQYFSVDSVGSNVTIALRSAIPEDVIFEEKVLLFNILADKALTVGSNSAILIRFPAELTEATVMHFTKPYYVGVFEQNNITMEIIILETGYEAGTEFLLFGEYAQHFQIRNTNNMIQISNNITNTFPSVRDDHFIILTVEAQRDGAVSAWASVVIEIVKEEIIYPMFNQAFYRGSYTVEDKLLFEENIYLTVGYDENVTFHLQGEYASWFSVSQTGNAVALVLESDIPPAILQDNNQLLFPIIALNTNGASGHAVISIDLPKDSNIRFSQEYYKGLIENGLLTLDAITLQDISISIDIIPVIRGDYSEYFQVRNLNGSLILEMPNTIPPELLNDKRSLILTLSIPGRISEISTVIVLEVVHIETLPLEFVNAFYVGSYNETQGLDFHHEIKISGEDFASVVFELEGNDALWFGLVRGENSVQLNLTEVIPPAVIINNQQLIFTIRADRSGSTTVRATIVISLQTGFIETLVLGFDRVSYLGSININKSTIETITLREGYDIPNVDLTLHGELSVYFVTSRQGNAVTVTLHTSIPEQSIPANKIILLGIQASAPAAIPAYATLVFQYVVNDDVTSIELVFARTYYTGTYAPSSGLTFVTPISLAEGYDGDVQFSLEGDDAEWFELEGTENSRPLVLSSPIPTGVLANNQQLVFVVNAQRTGSTTARATIVISLINDSQTEPDVYFEKTIFEGIIQNGVISHEPITVFGFTGTVIVLVGEFSSLFEAGINNGLVTVSAREPLSLPEGTTHVALELQAGTAKSVLIFNVNQNDSQTEPDVYFEKTIFEGIIQNGVISHEPITVFGFTGTVIVLVGEFSSLFEAGINNGLVTVSAREPLSLPEGTTHVALELQAGTAKSVLIFNVNQNDVPPTRPVVTFSAASYVVRVDVTATGLVGRVHAEADSGEAVRYSLQLTSEHLQQRLSVNDWGELHLSAPVDSGRYTFLVAASTVFTQETGTATIYLSAEAVTVCGEDIVMPPLIVLDRDEEEPHFNLVEAHEGCHLTLSNRWPEDQAWLYVNETGLHTSSIDREHESIAFMPLSQVQVEITLLCDGDATRVKRSLNSQALALNDFGTSRWVLTDTILYNARQSLVNLIVNDINDNAPIFVGKDREPIAVGYPVPELEEKVLPRSLVELQATDADIGENAELVYWSSESVLAVAPSTGFVHVRDAARVEHGSRLTVNATDRNGQGLTGSIDIVVRLLDQSYILVVTVRDTFLHDERNVLSRLSDSVGYEIKVLRSVVVSNEEIDGRTKRDAPYPGASLQLYVYGLIEGDPVTVERLTADINAAIAEVNIASTVSLEDHLAAQEICAIPGRDTGLLVATIVLSVLLFIVIVLVAVWFFLRWRRGKNYNQFSDANSLASRNESVEEISKPVEVALKPRLNIEELKKSERRLRELLEEPVVVVPPEPNTSIKDAILDMPLPTDVNTPIVIQSIDKLKDAADESSDDEFGERNRPKRKSVVTFNENVEKIIHVEETDSEDISTSPGYEIYKL